MAASPEWHDADRDSKGEVASIWRSRSRPRAIELLERVLAANAGRVDVLAEALMTSVETIEKYRSGVAPMPLERQLLLAAHAIEQPACARLGHLLRGQIRATISFAARETSTHRDPPPSTRW